MAVRSRMLVILIVLVLGFSASGLVIAQSSGPDPNSPVQDRTPTPGTDQKSDHPTLGARRRRLLRNPLPPQRSTYQPSPPR